MLQPAKSIQLAVSRLGRGRSAAELHWDCYHGVGDQSHCRLRPAPGRELSTRVKETEHHGDLICPNTRQCNVLQCWRVFPPFRLVWGHGSCVPLLLVASLSAEVAGGGVVRGVGDEVPRSGCGGASWVLVWCCHLGPRTRSDCCWLLLASPRPATSQTPCLGLARPARPAAQRAGAVSIPQLLSSAELYTRSRGTQGAARGPARGPGGPGAPASGGVMSSSGRIRPEFPVVPRSLSQWRGWRVAAGQGWPGPGLAARLSGPAGWCGLPASPGPDKVTALCECWCRPSPGCQHRAPANKGNCSERPRGGSSAAPGTKGRKQLCWLQTKNGAAFSAYRWRWLQQFVYTAGQGRPQPAGWWWKYSQAGGSVRPFLH